MGLQQSKPEKELKQKRGSSCSYYGGSLTHNFQTNITYQQFTIQQKYLPQFASLIQSRQALHHENFITIKNHWKKPLSINPTFNCTSQPRLQIIIQYQSLLQTLSKVLDRHSQTSRPLAQDVLIRTFLSVVSCLLYLKSKGTCHGDLKPQSVYFDNLGQVRLMDSFFINGGKTNYEIVMENPSSMSLLSPEQLQRLRDRQFDDVSAVYDNQAFSLGLVMYQFMTFQPAMECYDLEKLRIKKDFFKGKDQLMLANGYSSELVHLVLNLLLEPAFSRIKLDAIHDILTQFSY